MSAPHTYRLDLTRPRPGQRIHRSVTLIAGADGGARLGLHVGRCEMSVDLSADDLWQLIGMVTSVQLEQRDEVPA